MKYTQIKIKNYQLNKRKKHYLNFQNQQHCLNFRNNTYLQWNLQCYFQNININIDQIPKIYIKLSF